MAHLEPGSRGPAPDLRNWCDPAGGRQRVPLKIAYARAEMRSEARARMAHYYPGRRPGRQGSDLLRLSLRFYYVIYYLFTTFLLRCLLRFYYLLSEPP